MTKAPIIVDTINNSPISETKADDEEFIVLSTQPKEIDTESSIEEKLRFDTMKASINQDRNDIQGADTKSQKINAYQSKWTSSQISNNATEIEESLVEDDEFSMDDISFSDDGELPIFADEECKRLHKLTKILERDRDEAARSVKENKDRISIMHEHLHNVRQEIDHTNALVAAKNKEIATEKHLIALGERERAVMLSDIKEADATMVREEERLMSLQNQIHVVTDEREKLKLNLNWNQEELEQWATAAAKKEADTLALEKYTRADEVKIKELTLKLEHMTKKSAEKKAELDNEITETQSKQLEVARLAESFRSQHEERRLLVQQWQDTIKAMKDRDSEISVLSDRFAEAQDKLNNQQNVLTNKREELSILQSENEALTQDIETAERMVQNRRQEKIAAYENLQTFQDEMDALKLESIASSASLERMKASLQMTEGEATEKMKQLHTFRTRYEEIKMRLDAEKEITASHEKTTQIAEERLKDREKELKTTEHQVQTLKQQMFKDSQILADLRQKESDLISEIRSTQATSKNLSSKLKQLEKERSRQQELLYNAEFELQQMERKIARGLGERSDEEKKQLQYRIEELELEYQRHKDKKSILSQQGKKLQQELKKWQKKKEYCDKDQCRLNETIVDVELEITACELNLKKLTSKKEEEMVSHDLVRLEVRRLRDILRNKVEEVLTLENQREDLYTEMSANKAEIRIQTEVKIAQLRAFEDERHKSKVELGQRKIAAEKMQLKHQTLTKAHHNDDGEEEEISPVYHLIAAAQKRAELQREGDLLDKEIRSKEKELKAMEKTLSHLRERNTDFRSSFSKVDKNSQNYQEVVLMDDQVKTSERELLEAKKACHVSKRKNDGNLKKLEQTRQKISMFIDESNSLEETNSRVNNELQKLMYDIEEIKTKVKEEGILHRKRDYPNLFLKDDEESIQELLFRAEIDESHTIQIIDMLVEIGREFPDIRHSVIESLAQEKIDVQI